MIFVLNQPLLQTCARASLRGLKGMVGGKKNKSFSLEVVDDRMKVLDYQDEVIMNCQSNNLWYDCWMVILLS